MVFGRDLERVWGRFSRAAGCWVFVPGLEILRGYLPSSLAWLDGFVKPCAFPGTVTISTVNIAQKAPVEGKRLEYLMIMSSAPEIIIFIFRRTQTVIRVFLTYFPKNHVGLRLRVSFIIETPTMILGSMIERGGRVASLNPSIFLSRNLWGNWRSSTT